MPPRLVLPLLAASCVTTCGGCTGCGSEARLVKAARDGELQKVKDLLDRGVDPDCRPEFTDNVLLRGPHPRCALYEAVLGGHEEVARTLLLAGADPDLPVAETWAVGSGAMHERRTPLWAACVAGEPECLKVLLAAGVDLRFADFRLADAARGGGHREEDDGVAEVVRLLLGAGANPDGRPGHRPLMNAVGSHRVRIMSLLLDAGADPNLRDETALASWSSPDNPDVPATPGEVIAGRPAVVDEPGERAAVVAALRAAGARFPPVDAAAARRGFAERKARREAWARERAGR